MGSKNPRTYTPEEKRKAIARAAEVGSGRAALELGIPSGTMSSWLFYARRAMKAAEEAEAAQVAAQSRPEVEAPQAPDSATPMEPPSPPAARSRVAKVYTPAVDPSTLAQALSSPRPHRVEGRLPLVVSPQALLQHQAAGRVSGVTAGSGVDNRAPPVSAEAGSGKSPPDRAPSAAGSEIRGRAPRRLQAARGWGR